VRARPGAYSSLSVGLPTEEAVVGALNIYGTKPQVFNDDATPLAQTFAGQAAVAMANAHLYDSTAVETRTVIEQAKAIIMGERRCTAEEAFVEKAAGGQAGS
jgi:GAF domain-containing protein